VYAGHAAIALALKAREPRLPIVPLTLACFGPDWVEVALLLKESHGGLTGYPHSIPGLVMCAALAGLVYAAFRRPGAWYVVLAWLLHWPADLFTGRKPIITGTYLVGLDLYSLPAVDFVLESLAIAAGCALYARRFAPRADLRRVVVVMGITLVLLQGAIDVTLSVIRRSEWTPSFALFGSPTRNSVSPGKSGG